MWKHGFVWSTLVVIAALLTMACAPKPTPPTSAAPATTRPAAPAPTPQMAPDDAAWAKVVEAAKREGNVTAYGSTWTGDVGLAISKAFKDRYGITVDIIVSRGAEFVVRVETERRLGQVVGDMVEAGSAHLSNMSARGLLASTGGILPVLREKGVWEADPTLLDPEKRESLGYRMLTTTPFINTRLVKSGEEPNSWKDLLDPKWKGKMVLLEPRVTASFYQVMVPLLEKKIWDENYVKALYKQEPRFAMSSPDAMRMLASGESPLLVMGGDSTASNLILEGAPIKAIDMREGVTFGLVPVGAIAKGPHPNATLLFLNWLLEDEGQTAYGKTRGARMVRSGKNFLAPGSSVKMANPIFQDLKSDDTATEFFNNKWFDKLVGR